MRSARFLLAALLGGLVLGNITSAGAANPTRGARAGRAFRTARDAMSGVAVGLRVGPEGGLAGGRRVQTAHRMNRADRLVRDTAAVVAGTAVAVAVGPQVGHTVRTGNDGERRSVDLAVRGVAMTAGERVGDAAAIAFKSARSSSGRRVGEAIGALTGATHAFSVELRREGLAKAIDEIPGGFARGANIGRFWGGFGRLRWIPGDVRGSEQRRPTEQEPSNE